jgi:hypothetical protein
MIGFAPSTPVAWLAGETAATLIGLTAAFTGAGCDD